MATVHICINIMHIKPWLAMLKHKYIYKLNYTLEAEHEVIALLQSRYM